MRIILFCILFLLPFTIAGQSAINELEELANGYNNQGKPTQAAEFYSKAGYAYWNKNDNARAVIAFQKAYDLFSNQGNTSASIAVGNNLGIIYLYEQQYRNAYVAFNNVLTYSRKTKNVTEIFNALVNLGSVATELSTYSDAIAKTNEALTLAKEMNSLKSIAKCYRILAESYEKMGDASNAYNYSQLYSSIDQKIKKQEMEEVKTMTAEEINKAHETKRIAEIELKIKKGELKLTQDSLSVSERIAYDRKLQVDLRNEQHKKDAIQAKNDATQILYARQKSRNLIIILVFISLFLLLVGFMLWQKFRDNRTLKFQKEEITGQRNKLDIQNKKITDSIHYGLRIQQAMLPDLKELEKRFETFVIFKPKDIVSGDFYWFYEIEKDDLLYRFIAVVDCTGHGVPGAFMSMIGHRLLTEVIVERKIYQPSKILEVINNKLRIELDQDNKKSNDGMDIAFCRIQMRKGEYEELVYAGAKRPLIFSTRENDELMMIDADRKGIGGFLSADSKTFDDKIIKIKKGDLIILYTDGIIDQHNKERKRFGTELFMNIIRRYKNEPMSNIRTALEMAFYSYAEPEEQRDDVSVLGLRLN